MSSIKALAPSGAFGTHPSVITLAIKVETGTQIVSYDKPSIHGSQYSYYMFALIGLGQNPWVLDGDPNVPIRGHGVHFYVAARGLNFGSFDYTPGSRVSDSGALTTKWHSDTVVKCRAPQGRGFVLSLTLTTGERPGTRSEMVSYDSHVVKGALFQNNTNAPSTGSTSFTISGLNFEMDYGSLTARAGQTTCEASMWHSDSVVTCKVASGILMRRYDVAHISILDLFGHVDTQVVVTMKAFTKSSGYKAFSYDSPRIFSGNGTENGTGPVPFPTNVPVYMGDTIWIAGHPAGVGVGAKARTLHTLTGANFGHAQYTAKTRLGFSDCEATVWQSDSSLTVLAVAWSAFRKAEQSAVVSVGPEQLGTRSQLFTYDDIRISGHLHPSNAVPRGAADRFTSSLGWVTVIGEEFGAVDGTMRVREHFTSTQRTIWVSDSAVLSRASAGAAASRTAILTSGIVASSSTEAFSFEVPAIEREYLRKLNFGGAGGYPKWRANGPSIDGMDLVVTLVGSGFSASDYTGQVTISTAGTDSGMTTWVSDSTIESRTVHGAGQYGVVKVSIAVSPGTITNSWTYDLPTVSSLLRRNGRLQGNFLMIAYGENFGAEQIGYTAGAQTGDTACEQSRWLSRTAVLCFVPNGIGAHIKFVVTSLKQVGVATSVFSYDSPQLIVVEGKTNAVSTGSVAFTIHGFNFAARDASPMTRVSRTDVEYTIWTSDSQVVVAIPTGISATLSGVLSIGRSRATTTYFVTYDVPTSSGVSRGNFVGLGLVTTTIFGAGFSHSERSLNVNLGGCGFERTDWISETSLLGRVGHGTGMTKFLSVTSGIRVGSRSFAGTYDTPIGLSYIK